MRISSAFLEFRKGYIATHGLAYQTDRIYQECIKDLTRFTGDINIENLTPQHLLEWRFSLDNKDTTIKLKLYKVRAFLVWTNQSGITVFDTSTIIMPRLSTFKLPKYIAPEDISDMIDLCLELRHRAVIATLFSTGCRASELSNAKRSDYTGTTLKVIGKGNKERITYIDPRAQYFIDEYLSTRKDHADNLFLSRRKNPLNRGTVLQIVKKASERAGLQPINSHQMRHSFAVDLVKHGAPMPAIQQMLGHAFLSTTQVYTMLSDEDNRKIYEKCHNKA